MSRKPNFDVNVDGRTNGRTEIWTPISHPAISRCDKNQTKPFHIGTKEAPSEKCENILNSSKIHMICEGF